MKVFLLGFVFLFAQFGLAKATSELKQEITVLAKANTSEIQNQSQIRKQLDQLISQLTIDSPVVTAIDWATYAPGSWRQIWSDEADNSPDNSLDRNMEKIFQYVNQQGRAVNFGERVLPNDRVVTFALEAVGSVVGNVQNTKILNAFSRNVGLIKGEYLENLANDILNGNLKEFTGVAAGKFPKGPIDATSDLTILFLDQDMKIGTAPNVFTGDSELFILERVVSVQ